MQSIQKQQRKLIPSCQESLPQSGQSLQRENQAIPNLQMTMPRKYKMGWKFTGTSASRTQQLFKISGKDWSEAKSENRELTGYSAPHTAKANQMTPGLIMPAWRTFRVQLIHETFFSDLPVLEVLEEERKGLCYFWQQDGCIAYLGSLPEIVSAVVFLILHWLYLDRRSWCATFWHHLTIVSHWSCFHVSSFSYWGALISVYHHPDRPPPQGQHRHLSLCVCLSMGLFPLAWM